MKLRKILPISALACSVAAVSPIITSCSSKNTYIYNLTSIINWVDVVPPPTTSDTEMNLITKYMDDLEKNTLILVDEIAYSYWSYINKSLSFFQKYILKINMKSFENNRATFTIDEDIAMESFTCKRSLSFNNVEFCCGSTSPTTNENTPWYLYAKGVNSDESLLSDKDWSLDFDINFVAIVDDKEQENKLSGHVSYLNMVSGQPEYVLAKSLFTNFANWKSNYFRSVTILE